MVKPIRKLILLMIFACGVATAQAQADLWRYDASSGKWLSFGDMREEISKIGKDSKAKDKTKGNKYLQKSINKDGYNPIGYSRKDSPFLNLTVYSNVIYDAALAPSAGLELSFGKKWSTGVDGYVAWLQWQKHNNWWEFYGFDLYGRYWFGKDNTQPLTGYHIGLYAGTLSYDIYPNNKGYQDNDMFQTFRMGVEFGYSQYLTKKNRNWRVDFYGGFGFLHTKQDVYNKNDGGGYYKSYRRYRNLPDFTRFGITIGYMFGQKKK